MIFSENRFPLFRIMLLRPSPEVGASHIASPACFGMPKNAVGVGYAFTSQTNAALSPARRQRGVF
jgi:hypothetical protein